METAGKSSEIFEVSAASISGADVDEVATGADSSVGGAYGEMGEADGPAVQHRTQPCKICQLWKEVLYL